MPGLMARSVILILALFLHLAGPSRGQKAPSPSGQTGPVGPSCTASFTAAGVISSPSYPNNYADYTVCTYVLTAASGGFIKLTFNDFDLEAGYDFLTIIVGNAIIGRYTGSTRPPVLTLGRSATLRFTSDFSIVKKGFSITLATIPANCGGVIVGSGLIQSPGYPQAYSSNLVCVWGVVATQGKTVTVDFKSFNLEAFYDWLELYDGDTLVARYTEWNIPPQANLGPAGRVVFITDSTVHNSGVSIAVASTALACGGTATGYTAINSPNYPSSYPANATCTWTYRASSNSVATRLSFSAFNLESNYDYVRIYDGEYLRVFFTGAVLPKPIHLRSHTITVIFTSDRSVEHAGFRLNFAPVIIS